MNWEAIGAIGELIGAAAVVATLLYLAAQIKSSTRLARAESQRDLLRTAAIHEPWVRSPDLLRRGLADYEGLTPDEQAKLFHMLAPLLNHVEATLYMYRQGLLDENSYLAWRAVMVSVAKTPGGAAWWKTAAPLFGTDIVGEISSGMADPEGPPGFSDLLPFYRLESDPPPTELGATDEGRLGTGDSGTGDDRRGE